VLGGKRQHDQQKKAHSGRRSPPNRKMDITTGRQKRETGEGGENMRV